MIGETLHDFSIAEAGRQSTRHPHVEKHGGYDRSNSANLGRAITSNDVKTPLVSVILTNRNYENLVCQAIQSVADQTYDKIECVIVDDCSTDGSVEVVTSFLASLNDRRFRLLALKSNLGQMGAINAGLQNTTGEFASSIDADDLWMPDFVAAHVAAHLNTSYSAGMSASDTVQIDGNGTILEATHHSLVKDRAEHPEQSTRRIPAPAVPRVDSDTIAFGADGDSPVFYIDRDLAGWHYVATSAMMFRRAMLDLIMPDDPSTIRMSADYYLATFSHWITGSLTIGRAHSYYRRHGKNNFGFNPVFGGPHPPGQFPPPARQAFDEQIANHLIGNIDRLGPVFDIGLCAKIIRRVFGRKRLYDAVKRSPALRLYFGRGSDLRFRLKYGFFYRWLRLR